MSKPTNKNYLLIYRSLLKHWIWPTDRAYTDLEAWIWLLVKAAHTPHKQLSDGKLQLVAVGELLVSVRDLAKVWGWGRPRVNSFLELLKKDGMIDTNECTRYDTRLKINNYGVFQGKNQFFGANDSTNDRTSDDTNDSTNDEPMASLEPAQGAAEDTPINKGKEGLKNNTSSSPAKAGDGKQKSEPKYSAEAREIVKHLSDLLKQRGAREGQFSKQWAFAGFTVADDLLQTFSMAEIKAAIDHLIDHKFHGTGITSMSDIARKFLIWQRETGGTVATSTQDDPMARGCK